MSQAQNPYSAPAAAILPLPQKKKARFSAAVLGGLSALALVSSFFLGEASNSSRVASLGFLCAAVLAFAGAAVGVLSTVAAIKSGAAGSSILLGAGGVVVNLAMMLLGALATFISTVGFQRGRQLRSFGRVLLPKIKQGGGWATLSTDVLVDPHVAGPLAAQWRENGRTEHASVAAFARLTLDLMALGSPSELVASANCDALDEIRHTELCFSLARALDGKEESPGPFPEAQRARTLSAIRPLALAQLAVDSLVDGALHEGVSARVIARLAKRCEVPAIKEILREIAADEGRHAAHGWDVVVWCVAEGGTSVVAALDGAIMALPKAMHSPLPDPAKDGGWERYGIHGHALEANEYVRTRVDLVRRVAALRDPLTHAA